MIGRDEGNTSGAGATIADYDEQETAERSINE
jgi:hypothetical protein